MARDSKNLSDARTIEVAGWSMWPLLRPQMRVYVRPLDGSPRIGAILVFVAADRIVVHRLIRWERGSNRTLVTKGDLSPRFDVPIQSGQVLGEVVAVPCGRFLFPVANPIVRRIGWLFAVSAPAVRRMLGWMKTIGRGARS